MIKKNTKCVRYRRVSTDEQAEKGYSLEIQDERILKFCSEMNIEVLNTYTDDCTGKNFNRPGFKELVKFVKKNKKSIDYIFILKWDRFSRATVKGLTWIFDFLDWGVQVQAIECPIEYFRPETIVLLSLYLSIPQMENDSRASNIKRGVRKAMMAGRCIPHPNTGFEKIKGSDGKSILVSSKKVEVVREFFYRVATESTSINQIRKELRKKGLNNSRSHANELLANPVYIGKIRIRAFEDEPEQIVEGNHQGIIDEYIFNKVQERLLKESKKKSSSSKDYAKYYLKEFFKCGVCGKVLTASTSGGNGGKYIYYHCLNNGCKQRYRATLIERHLVAILEKIKVTPSVLQLYQAIKKEVFGDDRFNMEKQINNLETEISKTENDLMETDTAHYLKKTMSKESYDRLYSMLTNKKIQLVSKKDDLIQLNKSYKEYSQIDVSFLNDIAQNFMNASPSIRKQILGSIFIEKFIFQNSTFRTIKFNRVIQLLVEKPEELESFNSELNQADDSQYPLVHPRGLEPLTNRLRVYCSTN